MSISSTPLGRVGPAYLVVGPLALSVVAGIGGVYGAAAAHIQWGVFNVVVFVPLTFAIGYVSIQAVRLGKVRTGVVAFVFGVVAAAAFMAGSAWALHHFTGFAGTVTEFLGERRRQGVTLFGNIQASGVWLVLAWAAQALGAWIVTCAGMVESGRPFCESCRSWAWKPQWRFKLHGPDEHGLERLKSERSLEAVTALRSGGDRTTLLLCDLGVCKCGAKASLRATTARLKGKEEQPGDIVVDDLPIYPQSAERLFEWAERHDPSMADKRPVIHAPSAPIADNARFDIPYPDGEPVSTFRWSGRMVASDCAPDNPFTRELRKRIAAEGFTIIPPALAAARCHEDLAYIAEACADWDGRPDWMELWREAEPESPEMQLILGVHGVKWAWQARGADWSPKNFGLFQQRLLEAEQLLIAAAESRPDDPTPCAWLIYAVKGISAPLSDESAEELTDHEALFVKSRKEKIKQATAHLKDALRRSPFHRPAHSFFLDLLTPKWHGDEEKVLTFARNASKRAPAGQSVHTVIAEAHYHIAFARQLENGGKDAFNEYLRRSDVQAELRRANELCFRPGSFKPTMDTPRARAWFAYTLWKAGLLDEAAQHLRIIGKSSPWGPFTANIPFSKDSVRAARRECRV